MRKFTITELVETLHTLWVTINDLFETKDVLVTSHFIGEVYGKMFYFTVNVDHLNIDLGRKTTYGSLVDDDGNFAFTAEELESMLTSLNQRKKRVRRTVEA